MKFGPWETSVWTRSARNLLKVPFPNGLSEKAVLVSIFATWKYKKIGINHRFLAQTV